MSSKSEVILGMPHLTYGGLSENWLLKTCGDLHWQAICQSMGKASHEIADTQGNRLYPSFVELLHQGARLSDFGENDQIEINADVRSLSARRIWSRQTISGSGGTIAMEMLTLFMKRGKSDNSNKGLEASDPDFRLDLDPFDPDQDKSEIVNQRSRSYDGEDYEDLAGLDGAFKGLNTFEYAPCPTVDFNGARLLYFANYQDILDRAEWMQFRDLSLEDFSTSKRHIKYFGNVDSRDTVRVEFMSAESTGNRLVHEAALLRGSDGKVIAEVETEKTRR